MITADQDIGGVTARKRKVDKENTSLLQSKKEATASPTKKKQRPEASPAQKDPAEAAPEPSSQAGEEPEPVSSAAAASAEPAEASVKAAGVVPAASPAATVREQEAGSFELAGLLPDWQDRPLCLKELQKDEEVHSRFNYIAGLPLVALASEGKTALLEAVLKGGGCDTAVVNMKDNNGNTALHLAAAHGRTTIAGLLLEAGAQPGIRNNDNLTAMDLAVKGQFSQIIALLQGAGTP